MPNAEQHCLKLPQNMPHMESGHVCNADERELEQPNHKVPDMSGMQSSDICTTDERESKSTYSKVPHMEEGVVSLQSSSKPTVPYSSSRPLDKQSQHSGYAMCMTKFPTIYYKIPVLHIMFLNQMLYRL